MNKMILTKEQAGMIQKTGLLDIGRETKFHHDVAESTARLQREFTTDEQMDICFTPLIIAYVAFKWADKVTAWAAEHKVQVLKKLSRKVKEIHALYDSEINKDLDMVHINVLYRETDRFCDEFAYDFTMLYYSVNGMVKKQYPEAEYDEVRTMAYMSILFIRALRLHNKKVNKMMQERLGDKNRGDTFTHPCVNALEELMIGYLGGCKFEDDQNVKNALQIFKNNLGKIHFSLV
jgi:hypothetical protein